MLLFSLLSEVRNAFGISYHSSHSSHSSLEAESSSIEQKNNTRIVILDFLQQCSIPYPPVAIDDGFFAACHAEAKSRGYPLSGKRSLRPFISGGVAMAITAYAHLPNKSTRVFISLYTAFLIYLDDIFQNDIEAVVQFNERFVSRREQKDKVLDGFADLLSRVHQHFGRIASNIIITATLNLVTALLLEYETQGIPVCSSADRYPTFSRTMSGASEAYAVFAFPSELPLKSYIHALPEMMIYINNGNDILSFYKEESAGETVNRVSFMAQCHGISKHEALRLLSDGAVDAHERVLEILAPHGASRNAYESFSHGYIGFHASLSRYRLQELSLEF